jgi:glycosyltransferase involved in cell wall biosynthesis
MVSIGLPVFNGGAYLEECLRAILEQTYTDFEIVISDNASTDNTRDICQRFREIDKRVRYIRQEMNLGAAKNYNIVFEHSRGKYFRWAAHDDVILPTYLESCVSEFEADSACRTVLVYPRTRHFDERTGVSALYSIEFSCDNTSPRKRLALALVGAPETILTKCYPVFGLMRADVLRTTRLIQPFISSDKVLLVELMLRGYFREITPCLFHRRLHDQTSLNACRSQQEVASWFDPANGGRFPMPYTRLLLGYLGAVRYAPLGYLAKFQCVVTIAKWCTMDRKWRSVVKEVLKRIFHNLGLGGNPPTPQAKEYVE